MSGCFPLAYIDPGTGSILLQLAVAGIIGCGAVFRKWIWRFLRLVTGRRASAKQ